MVPLDNECDRTPPHTLPHTGWREGRTSTGLSRTARHYRGLVQVNGRPPFQMWQGLPLQHYTMVYSMRSNQHQRGMVRQQRSKQYLGQRRSV